ncbi:aldo/keto reductase [Pseudonocardia cypriaca]|uniref:D-threo-aldose 1-dehydrogenase n=1 Tax=Pseudonocardia cypriaca TaxID=882449 RepID=A0A543FUX5_9PSEU|nr:aldo/keto reductase [Pseudonocardia cypriaca]TQM37620.1 D-threo-aldose 1-dehydrogenase [Pseudonocardia cypriaca]
MIDWQRPLGGTGLDVSAVCAGTALLASMPKAFGYEVPEERAIATVVRVLAGPITFLDTSNGYGDGESERRIGKALARAGGVPEGFVLATKVDPAGADFSGARVRRSLEESLERLGLSRVPLLYLHDPERISFDDATARGGPVEELVRIRDEGLAEHIGVAGGPVELMERFVRTGEFEVLITHNRWTLLDRSAGPLLDAAAERGVAVVNAACFGGGILAKGSAASDRYAYRTAHPEVLDAVRGMEAACARHGVPLPAAALQFSLRDPRIASTVVGFSRPERVDESVAHADTEIPEDLWPELDALLPSSERWLH